jgi:superfamily I DNA and RNA helicase
MDGSPSCYDILQSRFSPSSFPERGFWGSVLRATGQVREACRDFSTAAAQPTHELGRLANELLGASKGALLHRLESLYDEILIDEVQDLSAHDWEIADALLHSSIQIRMVGDIRQSVLATNPVVPKISSMPMPKR